VLPADVLNRLGEEWVLDARYHRDNFGVDYVRAMASAAGLVVHNYDADHVGIDLGIRSPGLASRTMSPGFDVLVRAWAETRQRGGDWEFDGLSEAQFNQLAGADRLYPRYLVLISLPERPSEYATVWSDGMKLRQLGYYRSFAAEHRIAQPDPMRPRTVRVPLSNALTLRALQELIESAVADS
jgi:hypothetical protein